MLQVKVVSQPPHEDFVVDVFGQEFVEGSYVQHGVESLNTVNVLSNDQQLARHVQAKV